MATFLRKPAAIVTALASASFAGAVALAPAASAADSPCLWAGTGYSLNTVVTANGFDYSCHNDSNGAPFWLYYGPAPAGTPDNVPGWTDVDTTSPTAFSVGAEIGWGGDLYTIGDYGSGAGWEDLGPESNFGIGGSDSGGGTDPAPVL